MKKFCTIALVAVATVFAANSADAQVRVRGYNGAKPVRVAPNVKILPPSIILKRAVGQVPGAKGLSVRLSGNMYVVKVKQGGKIIQLRVNPTTGAVSGAP